MGRRSWLRSADSACERRQRQLLLIANNLDAQLSTGSRVYATIVETWHKAMQVLDRLIAGIPQSVENPEILLGLSSWHLYPDMEVVHDKVKHVDQKDRLVAPGGIMTIGLHGKRQKDANGVVWSVPLSHLRYYGKPVPSKRELGICTSRITFEQFLFLCLGSLTSGWPAKPEKVARFFLALSRIWQKDGEAMPEWMRLFFESVQWYESLEVKEREEAEQIFFFGRRRCRTLFSSSGALIPDGFGLCNITGFLKALPCAESRISWLRNFLTSSSNLEKVPNNAVIRYYPEQEDSVVGDMRPGRALELVRGAQSNPEAMSTCHFYNHSYHPDTWRCTISVEFASVLPVSMDGKPKSHKRWIPANESIRRPCQVHGHIVMRDEECPWQIEGFNSPCTVSVHRMEKLCKETTEDCGFYHSAGCSANNKHDIPEALYIGGRIIPALFPIRPVNTDQIKTKSVVLSDGQEWCSCCGNVVPMRSHGNAQPFKKRKRSYQIGCQTKWYIPTFDSIIAKGKLPAVSAYTALGDINIAAVCHPSLQDVSPEQQLPQRLDLDSLISYLEDGIFSASSLARYLAKPQQDFWMVSTSSIQKSFQALLKASTLYRDLPNSTIDIEVTSRPLGDAKWVDGSTSSSALAKNFSCIAMFEGGLDIRPPELEDVIAISSGNSLYIAAFCLQDPWHEQQPGGILHTVGNVGKPGMSFLISPREPLICEPKRDKWQLVKHAPFDGKLESNLADTSLHLSFTGYEFPCRTAEHGIVDKQAFFVEAAVRAFDRREWVADLDLCSAFRAAWSSSQSLSLAGGKGRRSKPDQILPLIARLGPCNHSKYEQSEYGHLELTSVDTWIELLDAPTTRFIVRAKGDWLSRLAVFAVAMQTKRPVVLASDYVCWRCVELRAEILRPTTNVEGSWAESDGNAPALMILC